MVDAKIGVVDMRCKSVKKEVGDGDLHGLRRVLGHKQGDQVHQHRDPRNEIRHDYCDAIRSRICSHPALVQKRIFS